MGEYLDILIRIQHFDNILATVGIKVQVNQLAHNLQSAERPPFVQVPSEPITLIVLALGGKLTSNVDEADITHQASLPPLPPTTDSNCTVIIRSPGSTCRYHFLTTLGASGGLGGCSGTGMGKYIQNSISPTFDMFPHFCMFFW